MYLHVFPNEEFGNVTQKNSIEHSRDLNAKMWNLQGCWIIQAKKKVYFAYRTSVTCTTMGVCFIAVAVVMVT